MNSAEMQQENQSTLETAVTMEVDNNVARKPSKLAVTRMGKKQAVEVQSDARRLTQKQNEVKKFENLCTTMFIILVFLYIIVNKFFLNLRFKNKLKHQLREKPQKPKRTRVL